ncbi:MAG TPA: hypothetical protein VF548_02300 [Allosphingosinicella sp.]|jgi:hypothetical protein
MSRYFFDSRDNDVFVEDDEGWELPDVEAVKPQAAKALTELAIDVIPGSVARHLSIEVRDEHGPVLIATMTFAAIFLRPAS